MTSPLEEQDPKAGEAKFSLIPIPEVATMPWWSTLHLVLSSLDVKGRSYHLHNLMQLTLILGFDLMTIMFDAIVSWMCLGVILFIATIAR